MSLLSAIDWNCLADDSRHILNTLKGYVVDLFKEASVVDKITDGIKKKLNDPTMYRLMQALNVPGFGDSYMCSDYDLSRITTSDASISSASASAINIQLLDDNNITVTSPNPSQAVGAASLAVTAPRPDAVEHGPILVPSSDGSLTKISNEDGKVAVLTKVGLSLCGFVMGALTTAHEFAQQMNPPMSLSQSSIEYSQSASVYSDLTTEGPSVSVDELIKDALSSAHSYEGYSQLSQLSQSSASSASSVKTISSVTSNGVETIVVDDSSPLKIQLPENVVDETVNAFVGFNSSLPQMSQYDLKLFLTPSSNKRKRDDGEDDINGGRSKTRKIRKYKTMRYASSSKSRKIRKGKKAKRVTKRKQPKRKTMRRNKK